MSTRPLRHHALPVAILAASCAFACGTEQTDASALLITLDTTRQDALSCYGAPAGLTPNLDRLASEGIAYLEARTVAPITLPSHASMLTGLWPPRHGLRINGISRLPAEAETLAELSRAHGRETAAFLSAAVLDSIYALSQGFDVYDEADGRKAEASNDFERRDAGATIDAALAWFAGRDASRPFFCWLHLFDPHGPWPENSLYLPVAQGSSYLAQVAYMDREIGRFMAELEPLGALENTLVLVVGDHGESLGDRGESAHGVYCYESALRVPFIIRHADRRRAGERSSENVSVADVFPTLCEALDLPAGDTNGRSLLTGTVPAGRGVYFESLYGYANYGWSPVVGWLQDGRKYMHSPAPELYDLAADPDEQSNQADGADVSDLVAAIKGVETQPRLVADPPLELAEELLENLTALGYAFGGPVEEVLDTLAPSDRRSPHEARDEYVLIQTAFSQFADSAQAEKSWAQVLARNPGNRTAMAEHGYHLMQLERWQEAVERFEELSFTGELRSMHWVSLGACYENLGHRADATIYYRRALEIDPRNHAARDEYLRAMDLAGLGAEAIQELATLGVD